MPVDRKLFNSVENLLPLLEALPRKRGQLVNKATLDATASLSNKNVGVKSDG